MPSARTKRFGLQALMVKQLPFKEKNRVRYLGGPPRRMQIFIRLHYYGMEMIKCRQCGEEFSTYALINGEGKRLGARKYCLKCSPYGRHNTRPIVKEQRLICKCGETDRSMFYRVGRIGSTCKRCMNLLVAKRQKDTLFKAKMLLGGRCMACGFDRWLASLDFHHLCPSEKDPNFRTLSGWKWERVVSELKKCILLCSNCHRALHLNFEVFEERIKEYAAISQWDRPIPSKD